jgi:hypothetical protein
MANYVTDLKAAANSDSATVGELRATVYQQALKITSLESSVKLTQDKFVELEKRLQNHILMTHKRFTTVQAGINEARALANDVEAHGRRWALRIVGLPAPTKGSENPDLAKGVLIDFLANHMNITNIAPQDIDCAHRVGAVKKGKQVLLVRFFRRQIAEDVSNCRKILKGKGVVVYDDTTALNRTLLFDLSKRAEVVSSWCKSGVIWAKIHNKEEKVKISINDNIDQVLAKHYRPNTPQQDPSRDIPPPHPLKMPTLLS